MVEHRVRHPGQSGCIDDPLLHFTEQIDAGGLDGHSETANLTSIFACAGAVSHQMDVRANAPGTDVMPIDQGLAQVPRPTADWQPRQPNESFRTRIVLFESQKPGGKAGRRRGRCPAASHDILDFSARVLATQPQKRGLAGGSPEIPPGDSDSDPYCRKALSSFKNGHITATHKWGGENSRRKVQNVVTHSSAKNYGSWRTVQKIACANIFLNSGSSNVLGSPNDV